MNIADLTELVQTELEHQGYETDTLAIQHVRTGWQLSGVLWRAGHRILVEADIPHDRFTPDMLRVSQPERVLTCDRCGEHDGFTQGELLCDGCLEGEPDHDWMWQEEDER